MKRIITFFAMLIMMACNGAFAQEGIYRFVRCYYENSESYNPRPLGRNHYKVLVNGVDVDWILMDLTTRMDPKNLDGLQFSIYREPIVTFNPLAKTISKKQRNEHAKVHIVAVTDKGFKLYWYYGSQGQWMVEEWERLPFPGTELDDLEEQIINMVILKDTHVDLEYWWEISTELVWPYESDRGVMKDPYTGLYKLLNKEYSMTINNPIIFYGTEQIELYKGALQISGVISRVEDSFYYANGDFSLMEGTRNSLFHWIDEENKMSQMTADKDDMCMDIWDRINVDKDIVDELRPTASELKADETFFLYNIQKDGFLVGGNSWNTQASIAPYRGNKVVVRKSVVQGQKWDGETFVITDSVETGDFRGDWRAVFIEKDSNVYIDQLFNTEKIVWANNPENSQELHTGTRDNLWVIKPSDNISGAYTISLSPRNSTFNSSAIRLSVENDASGSLPIIGIFDTLENANSDWYFVKPSDAYDYIQAKNNITYNIDINKIIEGIEKDMVYVEGGNFMMGSTDDDEDDFDDEKPAHEVSLSSFSISNHEVTQAEWKAIMFENPSDMKGDSLPVTNVSWFDCRRFIRRLNSITGKHYRLPTEAEWEYAARGGNRSRGYTYSGSDDIDDVAWYISNSNDKTHAVASKAPNELGLYDMTGNVWEWCQDWYDENYYSISPINNPAGPASGSSRVGRGGSWYNYASYCRVATRGDNSPSGGYGYLGLRLAH